MNFPSGSFGQKECSSHRDKDILQTDATQKHWEILLGPTLPTPIEPSKSTIQPSSSKSNQLKDSDTLMCEQCNHRFHGRSRVSNLNKHVGATHIHKRPHVCRICGKKFQYPYKLNKHKKAVHLGIKPHRCPQCKRDFGDRSNMMKHVRNKSCNFESLQLPQASKSGSL